MTMRLFLLSPDTAWTGRVDQSSFTYPLGEVTYDTGAAIIPTQDEMTVLFGTTPGDDDLGRTRLRDGSSASGSGTLKIGRSSIGNKDGEVNLSDNAYITILNDYRVWAKIPYIEDDGTIWKDHDIAVGTWTQNLPPKANAGIGFAGTIDPSTLVITVAWDASIKSFANSGSISSYLWDVDDGTIIVGSSSSSAITATFPAGFRWVRLTVTDSNANTHTMVMPVFARDPDNDVTIDTFNIERRRITPQGQELNLRIRENIPEDTYPDGTLVMIWEDEPSDENDRSHVVFIGWHQSDPATIETKQTGILRDTVFQCLDVAGRLDTLPGFPQSVSSADSPEKWTQMSSPNMDKYLHYLLHWHSNALDLANWTNSGTGSDFPFVTLASDGESLFDQVDRRAQALVPDRLLTCDTKGQMATQVDPMLPEISDRTEDTQGNLTESDWTKITYAGQRFPGYHWLRGSAILANPTIISAIFCIAPGKSPGQGVQEYTSGEQLAKSQSDLNVIEGNRYARINAPQSLVKLQLAEGNNPGFEPAKLTWITLTLSEDSAAQRGLTWAGDRFLLIEVDIKYRYLRTGTHETVTLTLEREVIGYPAETYIIEEDTIPDPEWEPGDTYEEDPGEDYGDGLGTCYVFLSDVLARCTIGATSPTWVDITGSISGTSYDFILDPWKPANRAYALTSSGIWRIDDLDTTPTYTHVLALGDLAISGKALYQLEPKIQCSINVEDYIVCFAEYQWYDESHYSYSYCWYSYDAGATWNKTELIANEPISFHSDRIRGGFDVVPHYVGGTQLTVYASMFHQANLDQKYYIYKSTDGGASFTRIKEIATANSGTGFPGCLNTPYFNNEDGLEVWVSFYNQNVGDSYILKSTDGFSTYSQISLPYTGADVTFVKRLGIEIYVPDNNLVTIWNSNNQFYKSIDGGANFTEILYTGYNPAAHGDVYAAGGFPTLSGRYYILTQNRYVFISSNGGSSFEDKTGNLRDIIPDNETVVREGVRCGTIVPLWIAE